MVPLKHFNNIINEHFNYFFVIVDMSVYKSYVVVSFASLINKKNYNLKIASSTKPQILAGPYPHYNTFNVPDRSTKTTNP